MLTGYQGLFSALYYNNSSSVVLLLSLFCRWESEKVGLKDVKWIPHVSPSEAWVLNYPALLPAIHMKDLGKQKNTEVTWEHITPWYTSTWPHLSKMRKSSFLFYLLLLLLIIIFIILQEAENSKFVPSA